MVILADRPMRKVKLNLILKESEMAQVRVLEMNGEKIERSLNFIPSNRGYYNLVVKGEKLVRCQTAEEALEGAKKLAASGHENIYIKVPSGFKHVNIEDLRIA